LPIKYFQPWAPAHSQGWLRLWSDVIPNSLTKGMKLTSEGDIEMYKFSAWCRFPLYETDFRRGGAFLGVCSHCAFQESSLLDEHKRSMEMELRHLLTFWRKTRPCLMVTYYSCHFFLAQLVTDHRSTLPRTCHATFMHFFFFF
jgi:hypothetical protein